MSGSSATAPKGWISRRIDGFDLHQRGLRRRRAGHARISNSESRPRASKSGALWRNSRETRLKGVAAQIARPSRASPAPASVKARYAETHDADDDAGDEDAEAARIAEQIAQGEAQCEGQGDERIGS
jgi:hypothetical protein